MLTSTDDGSYRLNRPSVFLAISLVGLISLTIISVPSYHATAAPVISTVDSTGDVGYFSSIAIGTDGLPVISYWDSPNRDIKIAHCGDNSCSSGNIITSAYTGPRHAVGPTSIEIGSDGFPIVSYYEATSGVPDGDLRIIHCNNIECTSSNTFTLDSALDTGFYSSLAIGADGFPVVSYLLGSAVTDLKVAKCGNDDCSIVSSVTVDAAGDTGAYTSIAIGADGLPVISYQDLTNHSLRVAHCGNAACDSSNVLTTLDSVGETSSYSSITIGMDGYPVISYRASPGDLRVVHCDNTNCSSGTVNTVDSGNTGFWTSIAIANDGFPVISYYDGTSGDLMVADCDSLDCSSVSATKSVDDANHPSGNSNAATSISIGTDGFPVVSYLDSNNADLKVAEIFPDFTIKGFYPPVENSQTNTIFNSVKAGATVPLKFEIFQFGTSTEVSDIAIIKKPLTIQEVSCTSAEAISDPHDATSAGKTDLRYDTERGQFIYNWKTPVEANTCWKISVSTLSDGSELWAYFELK